MSQEVFTGEKFEKALADGPYAWPGGYPIHFVCKDGEGLCFKCAGEEKELILAAIKEKGTDEQWEIIGAQVNWEDPSLYCDHCSKRIESAYAEKD